jgi:hypothetical protein
VWLWHSYVLKPHSAFRNHSCVWCSHAYCDEHTHECNFWTQSMISTRTSVIYICTVRFLHALCDLITHKSDFYAQSVILTRMSVTTTCTSVIYTRTSWISTWYVWLENEPTKINIRSPKNLNWVLTSGYTTSTIVILSPGVWF